MLLRMIVSALNPLRGMGKHPASEYKGRSIWFQFRYRLFSFSVKCMLHLYRRYAYCDNVELDHVKILYSCRDEEFECWLKVIGKDVKPHLKMSKTDASIRKDSYFYMLFYGFFRFECQLLVMQDDKKLVVKHDHDSFVYSEIAGTFKKSASSDILIWTEFKGIRKSSTETSSNKREESKTEYRQTARSKKKKKKITPPQNVRPIMPDIPQSKKMRGVEIDESF